jgi:hypothetical protein
MIHYKQYSFDKNQLNNGSIEKRVMGNKEIIEEINKKIEICKEKINSKNTNKIISDIEKLIEQYKPENDIQKRIINNRNSEVNDLKNASKKTTEKNQKTNRQS